jgi:hypothetical protein
MNSLMRNLVYTLVHLRHEHKKLMAGDLFLRFRSQLSQAPLSPATFPDTPRLLQEYFRRSRFVNLHPLFLGINETQGSRCFFNTQLVVCDECYERCMLSDSTVPCAARDTHIVANEVEIMRSIDAHLRVSDISSDFARPAPPLPSVLLNVSLGAVDSIYDPTYYQSVQSASTKLKCAKAALESMMAVLTGQNPYLRDWINQFVVDKQTKYGLLHMERDVVASRTELMIELNQDLGKRLRNNTLMPSLSPFQRDSLLLSLDASIILSQGTDAIEYVRNSTRARFDLARNQSLDKIFKESSWLRSAFPSDPRLWTESSCARTLQFVESQVDEIGGILEFYRMSKEVLNREEDLLKLRQQLLDEQNDVNKRALESRAKAQSMPSDAVSVCSAALLERCGAAESRCVQLHTNQKFRLLLLRSTQGDNVNLTCDSCKKDLPQDWVLLRCCHKFCSACWSLSRTTLPISDQSCPSCHVRVSLHDVFESCNRKTGSELGCFEISDWTASHALGRLSVNWHETDNKELIRLSTSTSCSEACSVPHSQVVPSSSTINNIHIRPSGLDIGTRLAVCIRRIRCIYVESQGDDKVVIASFSFAKSLLKDKLVAALKQENISAVCVSGPQVQQAAAIQRFEEDPDIRVLLLDMHSSYSGVTLTAGNHLFLLDPFHHVPETQQIIARISRQGQRKPCFIYHMCGSGTVEEAVLVKRERSASVIQVLSAPISSAVPLPADVVAQNHSMPVAVNSEAFEPQVNNHSRVAEDLTLDVSKRPRSPNDDTSSHAIHRPASATWTLPSQDSLPPPTATPNTFSQQLPDTGPGDSHAPAGSTATALSPAQAAGNAAYDALSRMLYCAGVVPTNDYHELACKLIAECFPSESVIRRGLQDDPALLSCIGMKVGQRSCLTRYLSKPAAASGAAAAFADPEAAALSNLKSLFAAAGVIPDKESDDEYETMARRLMEQGVADGISLRDSLTCSPPALDLKSIVVKRGQAYTIMDFIDKM